MLTGYFCRYSLTQEGGPTDELTVSGMGERGAYMNTAEKMAYEN
jgi:hypothetical protein